MGVTTYFTDALQSWIVARVDVAAFGRKWTSNAFSLHHHLPKVFLCTRTPGELERESNDCYWLTRRMFSVSRHVQQLI